MQRGGVKKASVTINGSVHSSIGKGILVFLGVGLNDTEKEADYLARRCADLRIFEDDQAKMNLSVRNIQGSVLIVSQFTLFGDPREEEIVQVLRKLRRLKRRNCCMNILSPGCGKEIGADNVQKRMFRAMMDIQLINNGPVTIMIESKG